MTSIADRSTIVRTPRAIAADHAGRRRRGRRRRAPINILIVDDEPKNLTVLETVLDDPGYRLVRAESADQALLALVAEEFALLILDIRMPGMTGFELAQMIKERKKTARVPIIFLTAYYNEDQHVLEGYGTGAVDYLHKPVNPRRAALEGRGVRRAAPQEPRDREANRALTAEVPERRRAEEQLRELNETLEQRVAERTEALRALDRRMHAMMNSITDGLLTLDADWRCTTAIRKVRSCSGCSPSSCSAPRSGSAFRSCSARRSRRASAAPSRHGRRSRSRSTARRRSAAGSAATAILPTTGCRCTSTMSPTAARSRSGARQLLAAEQAARSEGERVARAKDEFLASLSHELRTPLAAIVSWIRCSSGPTPIPTRCAAAST